MSEPDAAYAVAKGDEVFAADGEPLGTVADVQHDVMIIEHGPPNESGYVIPLRVVASAGAGRIMLRVSREEVLLRAWDGSPERHLPARGAGADDEIVIPLAREELTATIRSVRGGPVRIATRVMRDVPATEGDIRVERRIVERPGDVSGMEAFKQIVVEIPLSHDTREALAQGRMAEEIVVSKETVQRIERVTDVVRREEISLDGNDFQAGDPRVDPDSQA